VKGVGWLINMSVENTHSSTLLVKEDIIAIYDARQPPDAA
jgi:hypothetical protein